MGAGNRFQLFSVCHFGFGADEQQHDASSRIKHCDESHFTRTMLTRQVPPPAPRPAARPGAGSSTSSRASFVPRALLAKKGLTDPSGGRREDVYVGKGKWVKDDPKKYAARDDWFTGGWPGGEVGLKEGFAREDGAAASKSEMLPAGDVRRGRTPAVGASRDDWDADSPSGTLRSPSSDDAPGVPSRDDRFGATAAAVRAAKYALVKRLAALDRGVAADDDDRRAANALVEELERLAGEGSAEPGGKKSYAPTDDDLERALDGEWRLAYSSTFAGEAGGSQGFTGAPGAGAPGARLGSVYQRLSSERKTCDNVVRLGFGPQGASFTGEASLGHAYVVAGSTTRITFTGVTLESGAFGLPRVTLPTPLDALPEDAKEAAFGAGLQSGAFDTTFVDDDVRVSRGDRGETRVFVR
jgi:hypothetical protein